MKAKGLEAGSTVRALPRKCRTSNWFAGWTVLSACVLAGVLSLAAPQTSYSKTAGATASTPIAATLFHDNFESGNLSNWTSNSGLVAQQAHVFRGSWAAEGTATGAATPGPSAFKDLAQGQTSLYYETWFNILSHSSNVNLLRFRSTAAANALVTLLVTSAGKLGLRNEFVSPGVPTTSATSVTTNAWHTVQVHVTISGLTSSIQVWLDGIAITDLSLTNQNLGTDPIGRLELGDPSTLRTFDVAFDNVVADSLPITPKCEVPKVVGKRLRAAKLTITQGHCLTGKVRLAYSPKYRKGIVISQSRRPGQVLPTNSKVNLVVSRGRKR